MFVRKFILSISLAIFLTLPVLSQTSIDSLKSNTLHSSPDNEAKVISYQLIAEYFLNKEPDSAKYYSQNGLSLSARINFIPGIFKISCTLGKVYLRKDSLDKAIEVFEHARDKLEKLEEKKDALCVLLLLGYAYDIKNDFYRAHEAMYTGLEIAEEVRDSAMLWSYYNNLGAHFMELESFDKSIEMLHKGLEIYFRLDEKQRKYSLASTYNNMAVTFMDMDLPDSARLYLEKGMALPDIQGNYYGMYNLYGNFGKVYLMLDDPEKAMEYFQLSGAALDSLDHSGFGGSITPLFASHYRFMGSVYYEKKDLLKARAYFEKALDLSTSSSDLTVQAESLEKLAAIAESNGKNSKALEYYKEYMVINDSLDARKADTKITRLTLEYQFEKDLKARQQAMELKELKHRRRELLYLFTIITATGLLISLLLLYLLQRSKIKRKRLEEKTMLLEKEKITEELDYKNKELTTNVMYLLKKNEFISSISQKLNDILNSQPDNDARILKGIINELDKMTSEDAWAEFELRFKDVHTDFYKRISHQYPDLTAQELRLCDFLRLNMTSKEIAAITYQSTESLKTARYRLRKKMGIDRDENLVAFLTRI